MIQLINICVFHSVRTLFAFSLFSYSLFLGIDWRRIMWIIIFFFRVIHRQSVAQLPFGIPISQFFSLLNESVRHAQFDGPINKFFFSVFRFFVRVYCATLRVRARNRRKLINVFQFAYGNEQQIWHFHHLFHLIFFLFYEFRPTILKNILYFYHFVGCAVRAKIESHSRLIQIDEHTITPHKCPNFNKTPRKSLQKTSSFVVYTHTQ